MNSKRAKQQARLFAALGDETRLRIVSRLANSGPLSIARLTEDTGITRQAVTKHLRSMRDARLVRCARRGRETLWTMELQRLREAEACLQCIGRQWDSALARLKAFSEA